MSHAATITLVQRLPSSFRCSKRAVHTVSATQRASIHGHCRRLFSCRHRLLTAAAVSLSSSFAFNSKAANFTSTASLRSPDTAATTAQPTANPTSPLSSTSNRTTISSTTTTTPPTSTTMPHNIPPYSLPATSLRSATHTFTTHQFDIYRLYALLATSAASNQLAFLTHLATYIPQGHTAQASESILLVQVYAGIPKTIEGMTVVRAELDRRDDWVKESGVVGAAERVAEARERSRAEVVRVMGKVGEALTTRWQTYDEPDRPPPSPSLSLSLEYPSLPAVHPPPPSASSQQLSPSSASQQSSSESAQVDINSTDARIQRGMLALNSVYSTATTKLLASLHHLHPSLHHSVLQHIYGAVLCTPILTLPAMELASVACLMGERSSRQLFSHVRGALMNGCTREMVECVMRDAEAVYREARRKEEEEAWGWVEEAVTLVRRIDRKVNPTRYEAAAGAGGKEEGKEEEAKEKVKAEDERRVEVERVVSRRTKESGKRGIEELVLKRSSSAPPGNAKL